MPAPLKKEKEALVSAELLRYQTRELFVGWKARVLSLTNIACKRKRLMYAFMENRSERTEEQRACLWKRGRPDELPGSVIISRVRVRYAIALLTVDEEYRDEKLELVDESTT